MCSAAILKWPGAPYSYARHRLPKNCLGHHWHLLNHPRRFRNLPFACLSLTSLDIHAPEEEHGCVIRTASFPRHPRQILHLRNELAPLSLNSIVATVCHADRYVLLALAESVPRLPTVSLIMTRER